MTQDEIIRMAREAGFQVSDTFGVQAGAYPIGEKIERFAALVAAHERNRHAWTQEHWTEYEHAIAAAEREACAKVCDDMSNTKANMNKTWRNGCSDAAAAIRARGE